MSNALVPITYKADNGNEITLAPDDVRSYLVRGQGNITDSELLIYMNQMKANGLDPFTNDAYLIKYSDTSQASIVLGKDAFVKRADNHPQYDGMKSGIAVINNNKLHYREGAMLLPGEVLVGGWCEVFRKDRSHPTHTEVSLKEYDSGKSNWAKMPATMICKVAKSQAQREAFPNQFAGFYDESEISESSTKPKPADSEEIIETEIIVDNDPNKDTLISELQEILGNKMREAKEHGIKVAGIKSRINVELGRDITDLNDYEYEKAIRIVQSIIDDKKSLEAASADHIDTGNVGQDLVNSTVEEAASEPYIEDVPFQ